MSPTLLQQYWLEIRRRESEALLDYLSPAKADEVLTKRDMLKDFNRVLLDYFDTFKPQSDLTVPTHPASSGEV